MELILFQPEIPQNTGNIVRTCSVTGCQLALVKPLGFSINDRHLKRAGLDYWTETSIRTIDNLEEELDKANYSFYFFSSKVNTPYTDIRYTPNDRFIFGSETSGLPSIFYKRWPDRFYTIPMRDSARCLNLSNSAAIVIYEGLRQLNFKF